MLSTLGPNDALLILRRVRIGVGVGAVSANTVLPSRLRTLWIGGRISTSRHCVSGAQLRRLAMALVDAQGKSVLDPASAGSRCVGGDSRSMKSLTTSGRGNESGRSEVKGDGSRIAPAATAVVSTVVSLTLTPGASAVCGASVRTISLPALRPHWVALSASANRSSIAALTAPTQSDETTLLNPSLFPRVP